MQIFFYIETFLNDSEALLYISQTNQNKSQSFGIKKISNASQIINSDLFTCQEINLHTFDSFCHFERGTRSRLVHGSDKHRILRQQS